MFGDWSFGTEHTSFFFRSDYFFFRSRFINYIKIENKFNDWKVISLYYSLYHAFLGFAADIDYVLGNDQIPRDTTNPVYFQSMINIERPLDHAKWLTPQFLNKSMAFLNKTMKYTKDAAEKMKIATTVGVIACTFKQFQFKWQSSPMSGGFDSDDDRNDAMRSMFMVCDRVACLKSPQECNDNIKPLVNTSQIDDIGKNNRWTGSVEVSGEKSEIKSGDKKIGSVSKLNFEGTCTLRDGSEGVYVRTESRIYGEEQPFSNGISKTITLGESSNCIAKDQVKSLQSKDFASGNACFSTSYPHFDDTKCSFFGSEGEANMDPGSGIISSIRCGCLTDTYSNLKVALRIQQQIYGCLQQAKMGSVKGSYCERLMSQAVCDVVTNVILPEVMRPVTTRTDQNDEERDDALTVFKHMKNNEKIIFIMHPINDI